MGDTPVGRFAPTPSGKLHAGNLLCALLAYLSAKKRGGRFLIRVEDLDAVRCPRAASEEMLQMLDAIGLKSDAPPLWQSQRTDAYRRAEEKVRARVRTYPCFCTRAQLHAAEAPRLRDGGVLYAGTCRDLSAEDVARKAKTQPPCLRVIVPDETIRFTDGVQGEYAQNLARECGDFVLRRNDGVYAYQLAVTADDGESGVTEVVRGVDLLSSTPRQIWLQRLLDLPTPDYYHIPLVCDASGRKLAKSEGDSAARLFDRFSVPQILGGLGCAAGILPTMRPASLDELTAFFDWKLVPRTAIYLPPAFCA